VQRFGCTELWKAKKQEELCVFRFCIRILSYRSFGEYFHRVLEAKRRFQEVDREGFAGIDVLILGTTIRCA
jgi:hypothetical protein